MLFRSYADFRSDFVPLRIVCRLCGVVRSRRHPWSPFHHRPRWVSVIALWNLAHGERPLCAHDCRGMRCLACVLSSQEKHRVESHGQHLNGLWLCRAEPPVSEYMRRGHGRGQPPDDAHSEHVNGVSYTRQRRLSVHDGEDDLSSPSLA